MQTSNDSGTTLRTRLMKPEVMGALVPLALMAALLLIDIPTCPTKTMFGFPCPGCGLTRAARALITGNVAEAMRLHPLIFVLGPLMGYWLGTQLLDGLGVARPRLPWRFPAWAYGALAAAVLGLWALRLAGLLGGHPDGVHLDEGMLWRAWKFFAQGTGS